MFELIIGNVLNRQYVYIVQKSKQYTWNVLNSLVSPMSPSSHFSPLPRRLTTLIVCHISFMFLYAHISRYSVSCLLLPKIFWRALYFSNREASSFLFTVALYLIVWMCHGLFNHSLWMDTWIVSNPFV